MSLDSDAGLLAMLTSGPQAIITGLLYGAFSDLGGLEMQNLLGQTNPETAVLDNLQAISNQLTAISVQVSDISSDIEWGTLSSDSFPPISIISDAFEALPNQTPTGLLLNYTTWVDEGNPDSMASCASTLDGLYRTAGQPMISFLINMQLTTIYQTPSQLSLWQFTQNIKLFMAQIFNQQLQAITVLGNCYTYAQANPTLTYNGGPPIGEDLTAIQGQVNAITLAMQEQWTFYQSVMPTWLQILDSLSSVLSPWNQQPINWTTPPPPPLASSPDPPPPPPPQPVPQPFFCAILWPSSWYDYPTFWQEGNCQNFPVVPSTASGSVPFYFEGEPLEPYTNNFIGIGDWTDVTKPVPKAQLFWLLPQSDGSFLLKGTVDATYLLELMPPSPIDLQDGPSSVSPFTVPVFASASQSSEPSQNLWLVPSQCEFPPTAVPAQDRVLVYFGTPSANCQMLSGAPPYTVGLISQTGLGETVVSFESVQCPFADQIVMCVLAGLPDSQYDNKVTQFAVTIPGVSVAETNAQSDGEPILSQAWMPFLPTLTSISPSSVAAPGSSPPTTTLTLAGTNLLGASILGFPSGTVIEITSSTNNELVASVMLPSNCSAGQMLISVVTPGGLSNVLLFVVTPCPPPTLTSISPLEMPRASSGTITLTGTNLYGATIGGLPGLTVIIVTSQTATQLVASLSLRPHGHGKFQISVVTADGVSNALTFRILKATAVSDQEDLDLPS